MIWRLHFSYNLSRKISSDMEILFVMSDGDWERGGTEDGNKIALNFFSYPTDEISAHALH